MCRSLTFPTTSPFPFAAHPDHLFRMAARACSPSNTGDRTRVRWAAAALAAERASGAKDSVWKDMNYTHEISGVNPQVIDANEQRYVSH